MRAMVITVGAMLVLGTFASAQYRDWDRGRDRRQSPYRSAQSDLRAARNLLTEFDRNDPNVRQLISDVNYAINELNGARTEIGETAGGLPPAARTRGRGMHTVADLLDRAHRKLSYTHDRDPEARTHADNADQKIQEILQRIEAGRD